MCVVGRLLVGFFSVSGDCFLLLFPVIVSSYCVRGGGGMRCWSMLMGSFVFSLNL